MKKLLIVLIGATLFSACNNSSDQGGAVDDGIGTMDTDGALVDSTGKGWNPATDTTNMEDRVDVQQRNKVDSTQLRSDSGGKAHEPELH